MKRLMFLLAMLAVVLMVAAAPVVAQEEKKGKDKEKKEKKDKMKEMPKTGGLPVDASLLGLGAGALLVGGGLLVRKVTR